MSTSQKQTHPVGEVPSWDIADVRAASKSFLSHLNSDLAPCITSSRHCVHIYSCYGMLKKPHIQRWTKRWALGCEKFLPGPAWLLLSRPCPPFSPSLYIVLNKYQFGHDDYTLFSLFVSSRGPSLMLAFIVLVHSQGRPAEVPLSHLEVDVTAKPDE